MFVKASYRHAIGYRPVLDGQGFLLICGLHRSGTSVLHRLLRAHPDISGLHGTGAREDEGQFLQLVYADDNKFGGPGRFAFDPRAHLTEADAQAWPDARQRLLRDWGCYLDFSKKVLIEKTPSNITRTRFLQTVFPEASFVFIARHPIAAVLATQKWSHTPVAELLRHWGVAHRIMLDDCQMLERSMILRYEDFVGDPAATLDSVLRFVGLPSVPLAEPVENHNDRYFATWRETRPVEDAALRALAREYDDLLRLFGYDLDPPFVLTPTGAGSDRPSAALAH